MAGAHYRLREGERAERTSWQREGLCDREAAILFWIGHAVQMAGGQFFGHRVLLDGLDFGDVKLLNHVKPRSDYHHLA